MRHISDQRAVSQITFNFLQFILILINTEYIFCVFNLAFRLV